MINKALLKTTTFHDLQLLAECFISLIERAQEENDLGLLDDIIDNIATYRIPLQIALTKARQAQQKLEQLEEVA
ncbi:hypothetical protein HmCmsJML070_03913 [Escherichia coli]|uniref:hypothetical protein n=1 Tax=Escherichia coli TaxID=562 RepID=UPI0010CB7E6E|nr:hypothetical protein [Escherichia coli]EFH6968849.1 hypothetical protein [Escherichia coli]GCY72654.1 hypothetical protein HmCmsJML070_03913 [Escherichia coli]